MTSSQLTTRYRQLNDWDRVQLLLSLDESAPEVAVALAAAMASEGCVDARHWLKASGRKSGHRALDRLQHTSAWTCLDVLSSRVGNGL